MRHPRFWTPREETAALDSLGYLEDPEARWTSNRHVLPVSVASLGGCTVVLGEPGMGKTTALDQLRAQLDEAGEVYLAFDLPDYTPEDLSSQLFGHPRLEAWRANDEGTLHLLLDSLDEGAIHVTNLTRVIRRWLNEVPLERLRLHLACRGACWPGTLERTLRDGYGDALRVYKLAPLRRCDIERAAGVRGVDPQAFLEAVHERGLSPFAHRPLTLNLLLGMHSGTGHFPDGAAGLYSAACLHLTTEHNPERRDSGLVGSLTPEQRLVLAKRIAAVMHLCGRTSLWLADDSKAPPHSLRLADVCTGGSEELGAVTAPLTRDALTETVTMAGLFEPRGTSEVAWGHRTYTEYLAASFCAERGLPLAQVRSLFQHGSGAVLPQLRGAAAWLATLSDAARQHFIATDPLVVLSGDVESASNTDRQRLVASVLQAVEDDAAPMRELLHEARLDQLAHPALVDQLRPHLRPGHSAACRRVTVHVAGESKASGLVDALSTIAHDPAEEIGIRRTAAQALRGIGGAGAEALRAFLLHPDEDLKGHALGALWPDCMDVAELFGVLTPPADARHDVSRYVAQLLKLVRTLPGQLSASDLGAALTWIANLSRIDDPTEPRSRLARAILCAAAPSLAEDALLPALVAVARAHLVSPRAWHQLPELRAHFEARADSRRRVLRGAAVATGWRTPLSVAQTPLVRAEDAEWICEQLRAHGGDEHEVRFWTQLLDRVPIDPLSPAFERLYDVFESVPAARPHLQHMFWSPLLGPVAARLRQNWQLLQQAQASVPVPQPLTSDPQDLVQRLLTAYEGGTLRAFDRLLDALTLTPESTEVDLDRLLAPDLTCYPGWEAAEGSVRRRILTAARDFVERATPTHVVGAGVVSFPDHAAYCALFTLSQVDADWVERLPASVWAGWAPMAIDFPNNTGDPRQRQLLGEFYRRAPDAFLQAVVASLDHEASRDPGHSLSLRKLTACWDSALEARVLGWLDTANPGPTTLHGVLDELLIHSGQAMEWCMGRVQGDADPSSPTCRAIAMALLKHAAAQYWGAFSSLRAGRPNVAEQILVAFALQDPMRTDLPTQLDEAQLGELWAWLAQRFPPQDDPHDSGNTFSERESIGYLRRALLASLEHRGTPAAYGVVHGLAASFPQWPHLVQAALRAHRAMLQQTWLAPTPSEFAALCAAAERRLVETPEELLAVIVESLERYQMILQAGDNPQSGFLWENKAKGTAEPDYVPRPEQDLSRHTAAFLRQDLTDRGVVIARECEVRQGKRPSGVGKSTDIMVSASVSSPRRGQRDVLTVIIEVKGCWNSELATAMQTQLVEDYMFRSGCRHGIYLVGCFCCSTWRHTAACSRAGLRSALEAQAGGLTGEAQAVRAIVLDTTHPAS